MDATPVTIREMPVSPEDRARVADLMSQPQSTERDIEIENVLGKYFGMLATVVPVPVGHTHDGKKHEGIEIHFRPGARSAYGETLAAQQPVSVEETFGDGGIGDESLGIIGGCTDPPRNVSPDDPTAQLCYIDPPGQCRYC